MIIELLNSLNPDAECLLRAISKHIDDEMLTEIAAADNGEDQNLHFAALQQIREQGSFPNGFGYVPMEVLELIRWSEPEDPDWKPGRTGETGHWIRAFSCAAILRAEHEPYNYLYNNGSVNSTVIQLICSLQSLPVDFTTNAVRHLSWQLLHSDPEGRNDSVRVYGVALLWLALQGGQPLPDAALISLAQWTVKRADELNWRSNSEGRSGLREMVLDCQKQRAWELLGVQLCELDLSQRDPELQEWVALIGRELAG